MGIETSDQVVEESTEPPICGLHKNRDTPTNEHIERLPTEAAIQVRRTQENPTVSGAFGILRGEWKQDNHLAHTLSYEEVAQLLQVDFQHGLTDTEAVRRLRQDGPNKIEDVNGVSLWRILLRQVSNSLTLVLVMAMGISYGIDDYIEGGVITAVIVLNIVIGFIQDYGAEKTIASLKTLSTPEAHVIREGRPKTVNAEAVVAGDIVILTAGKMVPADVRLCEGMNVCADESKLTGESQPASKDPTVTYEDPDIQPGDRSNMAWASSQVTSGRGKGIVVATGANSQIGMVGERLRDKDPADGVKSRWRRYWIRSKLRALKILGLRDSPLKVSLSKFAMLLFSLAVLLAVIVFAVNKFNVSGEVLIYGICVAVAIIPESLIAVLTITMAMASKSMARGNVIVRKLESLEAVGGVTNICSDKTGTLTQGKMVAKKAWIPGFGHLTVHDTVDPYSPFSGTLRLNDQPFSIDNSEKPWILATFLEAIALCNMATVYNAMDKEGEDTTSTVSDEARWTPHGEPTEVALQVFAMRFGCGKTSLLKNHDRPLLIEFPFDSKVKRMTVVHKNVDSQYSEAFMKGAAEVVLPLLHEPDYRKREIGQEVERLSGEGLRVICVAYRDLDPTNGIQLSNRKSVEVDLRFVGLIGLYDPPRPETAEAVQKCQLAGITVHMLTGDHIKTATSIAYEVGILGNDLSSAQAGSAIMAANDFDRLTEEQIDALENLPLVLARCSPSTKVRMVEAMHRRKAFCVMTGDGVNDSPALKEADVGIAMGKNGSDVAKDVADMVLADDNFASIVKAIEEGRRLFDNIQKFLMHLLISNISQVILLLIGLAFKDLDAHSVFPLSPLEILWVNLITSSFLAVGLGMEDIQPDIMTRPPHSLSVGVFTRELIVDKMIYGSFMGCLCLVAFVSVAYGAGHGDLGRDCNHGWNDGCGVVFRARATTYATLTFLLLVTAWEVKHFARSLFNFNPARNTGPFSVFPTVWQNKFLFWAVAAGFAVAFPVVYIPLLNRNVFKHQDITWEWGVVFGCLVVYVSLVESWKAAKRRFGIGSARAGMAELEEIKREESVDARSVEGGVMAEV